MEWSSFLVVLIADFSVFRQRLLLHCHERAMYLGACKPGEDSIKPVHWRSLIRVFTIRMPMDPELSKRTSEDIFSYNVLQFYINRDYFSLL